MRSFNRITPIVFLSIAACGGGHVQLPQLNTLQLGDTSGLVARGEYIVRNVAVCGHCHAADPEKNADGPLSGGFEFRDWRLGTVRAANLTSDSTTGLGRWTEAEIMRAIRSGEDREGHLIAPVMPYGWFGAMSDRDALAIARYLKTLPPVRNEVRNNTNLAYAFGKLFFLKVKAPKFDPVPARGATAEYGRYLSQHVALCADCHTPRGGMQQKPQMSKLFSGNPKPPKGFPAKPANLTPDGDTGIGNWAEEEFLKTIETGVDPDDHKLHDFMPYRYVRRMTGDDLRAIYRFLRTLPPIRHEIPHEHEHEGH